MLYDQYKTTNALTFICSSHTRHVSQLIAANIRRYQNKIKGKLKKMSLLYFIIQPVTILLLYLRRKNKM